MVSGFTGCTVSTLASWGWTAGVVTFSATTGRGGSG
ncbi:Uncharacterised protein [Bordetella pertussis]|nr:Uncharacterised protein [Bordetella pertussis]